MDLGLKDRVVVVTGGASGIGAAIVRGLVAERAVPVVLDRAEPPPADLLAWRAQVPSLVVLRLELSDEAALREAVGRALSVCGAVHGLVNNAGANDSVGLDAGTAAFRGSLERNLVHAYALTQLCRDALVQARGAIVNVSSKTALTGQGGTSGYVAAKAALLGLTREWAAELAPHGVRVNAVVPAEVMTPMYERWLSGRPDPAAALRQITARIPLEQRMTRAGEIADTVLFLLSARAGHTTGQWLHPDGGYVHLDRALP